MEYLIFYWVFSIFVNIGNILTHRWNGDNYEYWEYVVLLILSPVMVPIIIGAYFAQHDV